MVFVSECPCADTKPLEDRVETVQAYNRIPLQNGQLNHCRLKLPNFLCSADLRQARGCGARKAADDLFNMCHSVSLFQHLCKAHNFSFLSVPYTKVAVQLSGCFVNTDEI